MRGQWIDRLFAGQWALDFMRGPAIILVWLGAIGTAAYLLNHRASRFEYVGLARGLEYAVSAETGGRIESLLVDLCEDVKAGDIIVKMDDSILKANIETARAAIKHIEAQIGAERLNLAMNNGERLNNWKSDLAVFESQEEKYRVDALNLKVSIESDRIEEQRLTLEMNRIQKLLEAKVDTQENYDEIKLRHDQAAKRISDNALLAARIEKYGQEAKARREDYLKRQPGALPEDELLAPLRAEIRKQELALEELQIRRDAMLLRAPVSGRVSQLFCQMGQAVSPGEKVALISAREAFQVIGYAPENGAPRLCEKMRVEIARAGQPETIAEASVIRVGAAIEPIPERLWRDPRRPEFGRCFLISASAPLALFPGERMRIRPAP